MEALQTATDISFKNILFLTDFSESCESAFAYAMGLAKHYKARLLPAHACTPIVLNETTTANAFDEIVENSRRRLFQLTRDHSVTYQPLFFEGDIQVVFPKWVQEQGIDLVVVGTHGYRGLQRFLLGSTAEFIFRNASCPVLTVGPHVAVRPYNGFKVDSVLFPTDLGPHAEAALTYAVSIARENHAKLMLMHVVSEKESFGRDRAQVIAEARRKLKKLLPNDAELWCSTEIVVESGDPAVEVQGYAAKERPDLIVLGLPADKDFNSHFRTGVTYKIVSSAPCPVLTVRDLTTG